MDFSFPAASEAQRGVTPGSIPARSEKREDSTFRFRLVHYDGEECHAISTKCCVRPEHAHRPMVFRLQRSRIQADV